MGTVKPNVNLAWAQTGTSVDPGNPKYSQGWVTEKPSWQNFNYVLNRGDVFDKHVNEYGICVWDALTTYSVNSITQSASGNIYQSIQNANTGNDPDSSPTFWKSLSTGISQSTVISGVNAYTATISGVTSYSGLRILGFGISANTGACSLNINGLGAANLVKQNGVALTAGEIQNNGLVDIAFDGTSFQLMNPLERMPFFVPLAGTDTYTASFTGITSYYPGLVINAFISNTNTAASSLNINGLGAIAIRNSDGTQLSPGSLIAASTAQLVFTGGAFDIINSSSPSGKFIGLAGTNTYTATVPGLSAYYNGYTINAYSSGTNTGASTLNINGLGAIPIINGDASQLTPGEIIAGANSTLIYFSGAFQLINPFYVGGQFNVTTGLNSYSTSVSGLSAYYNGFVVNAYIGVTNTGSSFLNVNSLGAIPINLPGGGQVLQGDLTAGSTYSFIYVNGVFFLLSNTSLSSNSIIASGANYVIFRNGYKMQWGGQNVTAAGTVITFPISFVSNFSAFVQIQNIGPTVESASIGDSPGLSSFVAFVSSTNYQCYWSATGF